MKIISFLIFTNFVMVTKLFFTKFFFHYKTQNFTKILYYENLELYDIGYVGPFYSISYGPCKNSEEIPDTKTFQQLV